MALWKMLHLLGTVLARKFEYLQEYVDYFNEIFKCITFIFYKLFSRNPNQADIQLRKLLRTEQCKAITLVTEVLLCRPFEWIQQGQPLSSKSEDRFCLDHRDFHLGFQSEI